MGNVYGGHKSNKNLCIRFSHEQVHHQLNSYNIRPRHDHIRKVVGRAQRTHGYPPQRNSFTTVGVTIDHSQTGMRTSIKPTTYPSNCTVKTDQQSASRTTTKSRSIITATRPSSHTQATAKTNYHTEGATYKGGTTSKGGTTKDAAAVPTTGGPTHNKI